jgi:hypothetical protein
MPMSVEGISGIDINPSGLHSSHRSIVEISPPDIACRRLANWGAIQADTVKVTRRGTFEYSFQARRHLLIVHERAERREGESAMTIDGGFDAVDQDGSGEGLGQEGNGSGLQRSGADAVIGESRDENKRRVVAQGAHLRQQVQTAHNRHLYIRNDT